MDFITSIIWFMFLVNAINSEVEENASINETDSVFRVEENNLLKYSIAAQYDYLAESEVETNNRVTSSPFEYTTPSTEAKLTNTIDILKNQLNKFLVHLCASEIDRNKTASAILKFSQLADANASLKSVVEFYVENYEDSFDNLLLFIDHFPSHELQKVAYSTLIEAMKSKQINVFNLLSFSNFVRTKSYWTDDKNKLLLTVIKELIASTDLDKLTTFINSTDNPGRIAELVPTIVQGIDLTNFTDMDRIFKFSVKLPRVVQLTLISKVLSEMDEKIQYQHLFHVILQIRELRVSVSQSEEKCLLSTVEREIPAKVKQLLSGHSRWQVQYFDEFLVHSYSPKYAKRLLFVDPTELDYGWKFLTTSLNSVSIFAYNYKAYNYDAYLGVEFTFHNESFPTATNNGEERYQKWYLLFNSDLSHVQIKNVDTNELLIVDNIEETDDNRRTRFRVSLSTNCVDCKAGKWLLKLGGAGYFPMNSNC